MTILPIGKPTKPKVFHRHQRRTAAVMMAPELKTIVWMLEIMSFMMTVDVDSLTLEVALLMPL